MTESELGALCYVLAAVFALIWYRLWVQDILDNERDD